MKPTESAVTEDLFEGLECIEVTYEIARKAGTLKYAWERKGVTMSLPDVIIAATSLNLGLHLATDNIRDFPMSELKLFSLPTI